MAQLLENKNAILYGTGGLGGGIARAFAREGARVFLAKENIEATAGPGAPSPEQVEQMIAGMAALRRAPSIAQVADTAAFLASDRASGITSSTVNVTCGLVLA